MIFDGALGRAGDEDQAARTRSQCLFHCILNEWFVDDGQHLFGAGLGGWEEAGSSTGNGENGDVDAALLYYGHKGSDPIGGRNHTTLPSAALPEVDPGDRESLLEFTPLAAAGAFTTPVSPWAAEPPRVPRRARRPFPLRA